MGCRVSRFVKPTLTALCIGGAIVAFAFPAFTAEPAPNGPRSPGRAPASTATTAGPVVPVPVPGTYREALLITLERPDDTRLTVFADGKESASPESPILLSVNPGEERTFTLETELRSLSPSDPPIRKDRFVWRIDRRPPSVPSFVKKAVPGGIELTASLNEAGTIRYSVYHPFFKAVSGGSLDAGGAGKAGSSRVFLPEGAVLCAYGTDLAGNRGTTVSMTAQDVGEDSPCAVISPTPGNWANRQTLLIEASDGTTVRYSLDGSDPGAGGTIYKGPVLIDKEGLVTLRLSAAGSGGTAWNQEILFTVASRTGPSLPFSVGGNGIVDVGAFAELQLPQGYSCTIGDPPSSGNGQTGVLISAIRGLRRYYPITVTDGSSLWRWICSSGEAPETGSSVGESPNTNGGPAIAIHDWHFISVDYQDPVYFSLDGSPWKRYTDPILVDRVSPMTFSCYSPAWEDSRIQTVSLPPKPAIRGIDEGGITANPVYLSAPDSPFSLHYRAGTDFSHRPSIGDPMLDAGLLVEVPNGSVSEFRMRFLAIYDGRVHGELGTNFTVDRKAPRAPSLGIPESMTYSRSPVRIVPNGEDMVQLSISPPLYRKDDSSWLLQGDETKPVKYTIRAFGVDRAGNKSPVYEKTLTIDYNALYVDASVPGNGEPDGSPQRPFRDLDSALDAVHGNGKWRIYLTGSAPLRRSHTIQASLRVTGMSARIEASGDPVLTVYGGSLDLSACSLARLDSVTTENLSLNAPPRTFIETINGNLVLRDCSINVSERGAASLIRAVRSNVSCTGTRLSLTATDYAVAVDASDSNLYLSDCGIDVSARNASGVSASSGRMTVRASTVTVRADSAARALESWGASVVLQDNLLERTARSGGEVSARGASSAASADSSTAKRLGAGGNMDTAFWFDKKTVLVSDTGLRVKGFKYPRARAE